MEEPKRYYLKISQTFNGVRPDYYEHPEGMFVDYDDYAKLKADLEYFKRAAQRAEEQVPKLLWENEHLKAKLEEIRQAVGQHEMDSATKWLNKNFPKP
jgi:hypothetical protein